MVPVSQPFFASNDLAAAAVAADRHGCGADSDERP
jgi:hypothetical protein